MADPPPPSSTSPEASVRSRSDSNASRSHKREGKQPKREQVPAACCECRAKKVKCDAARPQCGRCLSRQLPCQYDVEPDTTRLVAAKRRHEATTEDLGRMLQLYSMLRTRPEAEAQGIYRLIRQIENPFDVLRRVQEADLLLLRRAGESRN